MPARNESSPTESALTALDVESAKSAGLRYVRDDLPGFTRVLKGGGVCYLDEVGRLLKDRAHLARIRSLVIPPAWTNVWVCPIANGHLQATGRDARGRKQYRYHPRWREARDELKYARMIAFARVLPRIRARVAADLRTPALSRNWVLATVTRLLETSLIRVGNEAYLRDNGSYGLTTLRNKHVKTDEAGLRLEFRGKSGKIHCIPIEDLRLARRIRKCQQLPGQELFQYLDAEGVRRAITSDDVNAYLRDASDAEFTAKDFRTWAGTVMTAAALRECPVFETMAQANVNVVQAIKDVAKRLGNTPAICRKCYVHPGVIAAYLEGDLSTSRRAPTKRRQCSIRLKPEETSVLSLLARRHRLEVQSEQLSEQLRKSITHVERRARRKDTGSAALRSDGGPSG